MSYDMADLDQAALFLYLDGHDPQSIQEQRRRLLKKKSPLKISFAFPD
jgi:hypothetical protein